MTLTPAGAKALAAVTGPGRTKTGTVNRAVVVYAFLEEQIAGGAAVLIRHPDGGTAEVRFL